MASDFSRRDAGHPRASARRPGRVLPSGGRAKVHAHKKGPCAAGPLPAASAARIGAAGRPNPDKPDTLKRDFRRFWRIQKGQKAPSRWAKRPFYAKWVIKHVTRQRKTAVCIDATAVFWCRWWDLNPHGVATNGF